MSKARRETCIQYMFSTFCNKRQDPENTDSTIINAEESYLYLLGKQIILLHQLKTRRLKKTKNQKPPRLIHKICIHEVNA